MKQQVTVVAAVAENGVIGNRGALPWRIPEDLHRFKALTLGKPIVMGRKTWESLPKKPLPGRTNIVVTRDPSMKAEGAQIARSFAEALAVAARENPDDVMVIGGEAIFAEALPLAQRIHLTEVESSPEGDAFMPAIDRREWREVSRDGPHDASGTRYSFVTLER